MDMIFIAGGFLVALLFLLSQSLVKGVGTVGGALKAIGLFILQKNLLVWSTSLMTETAAVPERG